MNAQGLNQHAGGLKVDNRGASHKSDSATRQGARPSVSHRDHRIAAGAVEEARAPSNRAIPPSQRQSRGPVRSGSGGAGGILV